MDTTPNALSRHRGLLRNAVSGFLLFHLASLAAIFVTLNAGSPLRQISLNILQLTAAGFGAAGAIALARSREIQSRTCRRGWLLIGLGCLSWGLGQAVWTVIESYLHRPVPFPGWPDVGFLAAYPLFLSGVILLKGREEPVRMFRLLVDSLIAASSVGLLSWYFVIRPLWHQDVSFLERLLGVAYPLGDLAIIFCASILFHEARAFHGQRRSYLLLAAGFCTVAAADIAFTYLTITDDFQTGGWIDCTWTIGWLLIGLSVWRQLYAKPLPPNPAATSRDFLMATLRRLAFRVVAPYLAAIVAIGLVIWPQLRPGNLQVSVLIACAVLLLLIMIHQVLAVLENWRLNRQLWQVNQELELSLADRTRRMEDLNREMADRQRAETELARHRDQLEELVAERTTELEAAHERLRHTQKLESLGVLAGGIAHDFNNLLTIILGNAELARHETSPEDPGRENLADIEKAARRAAELCRELLAYAGKSKIRMEQLDLNRDIREIGELLRVTVPKSVRVTYDLAEGLPSIEADASQIRQVVMNLITNAAEAVGERGGWIAIRTTLVHCEREFLDNLILGQELPAGTFLRLEVEDNGCGMSPTTQQNMFDPFYTTKFAGRGLGLAAVLGIIRGHRGAICCRSELGRGTAFQVFLPAPVAGAAGQDPPETRPEECRFASFTALLADNEPLVRRVASRMLERLGGQVVEAANGREALRCFEANPDGFDLVVLDLVMPLLGGEETLREIRRRRPDLAAVLLSGLSEESLDHAVLHQPRTAFLQKPLDLRLLADRIRAVLADQDPAPQLDDHE